MFVPNVFLIALIGKSKEGRGVKGRKRDWREGKGLEEKGREGKKGEGE